MASAADRATQAAGLDRRGSSGERVPGRRRARRDVRRGERIGRGPAQAAAGSGTGGKRERLGRSWCHRKEGSREGFHKRQARKKTERKNRKSRSPCPLSLSSHRSYSIRKESVEKRRKCREKRKKRLPAHLVQGGRESPRDDVDRRPSDRVGFGPPQPVRRRTATPRTITEKDPGI
jgi:hypothetical protein